MPRTIEKPTDSSAEYRRVVLLLQLRGNLERAVSEKAAELQQTQAALSAAEAEALHQEELAEMAKGELDEYRRRMAAEVEHARSEALKLVTGQSGRTHTALCFCFVWSAAFSSEKQSSPARPTCAKAGSNCSRVARERRCTEGGATRQGPSPWRWI